MPKTRDFLTVPDHRNYTEEGQRADRRMVLDHRNYRQLVDTTVEIANKTGAAEIVQRIVEDPKEEQEQYRKMVMETIEKVLSNLGASEIGLHSTDLWYCAVEAEQQGCQGAAAGC